MPVLVETTDGRRLNPAASGFLSSCCSIETIPIQIDDRVDPVSADEQFTVLNLLDIEPVREIPLHRKRAFEWVFDDRPK